VFDRIELTPKRIDAKVNRRQGGTDKIHDGIFRMLLGPYAEEKVASRVSNVLKPGSSTRGMQHAACKVDRREKKYRLELNYL
jgi:hypothetical protein